MIYAASSRALAQLEKRVHANGYAPIGQALFNLTLPADVLPAHAQARGLAPGWHASEAVSQACGDRWLDEGTELALWVPSVLEPAENNLIINAMHPRLPDTRLPRERDPFEFDPRLI